MPARKFHRHRVFDLAVGENPMQETVAKPVDRMLDSLALHKINPNPDYTHLVRLDRLKPSSLPDATELFSIAIFFHGAQHFAHGVFQADEHRARDDGVTDVELG